jgi:phage-related protein
MKESGEMIEYVVYKGKKFTIEWYYDDRGSSDVWDYFNELTLDRQLKLNQLVELIGDMGSIKNTEKFRNEDDQIYAFKPKPDRFFCFFCKGAKIIITNAFEKKTEKLPKRERDRALKYRADYIVRVKGGTYYDK